jgi:hypothetical protein
MINKETRTIDITRKKFKKSPKGYPIDWSGKTGIYLYSEWLAYDGYDGGGAWIHTYRDVAGEKALNAYFNAKVNSEEREFKRKMGIKV